MKRFVLSISVLSLVAASCGGGDGGESATTSTTAVQTTSAAPATTSAPDPTMEASDELEGGDEMMAEGLHVADTDLGSTLVAASGLTLYLFIPDVPGASNCVDECATSWPPLGVDEVGTPGDGVDATLLGEITRPDGSSQATYNDKPLYFFAADGAPGDVNGQGINDVWYVMGADGIGIGAPVADAATSLDY